MSSDEQENSPFQFWAWLRAFQNIVGEEPPADVPDPPVLVLEDWLYLAPMSSLQDMEDLSSDHLGITHVLSTNRMPPQQVEQLYWELRSRGIDHHYIAAEDNLQYDLIGKHWKGCREFIETTREARDNGKVLVHCLAGMNRSGTIAAAAMMDFGLMDLLEVIRRLKRLRGRVMTNVAFQKQLVEFAASIHRLGTKPEGYSDEPLGENYESESNQTAGEEWLENYVQDNGKE